MKSFFTLASITFALLGGNIQSSAQQLTKDDLKKMNKLEIVVDNQKVYPDARLFSIDEDYLDLAIKLRNPEGYSTEVYTQKQIRLDDIDEITITNSKKSFWYALIGGAILSTSSFLIAKEIFDKRKSYATLKIIGQDYKDGTFEPYLAGTIGLGIGVGLGLSVTESKVFPKKDKKHAYWRLKSFSYDKKKRKK
jgi:hypothetical protein